MLCRLGTLSAVKCSFADSFLPQIDYAFVFRNSQSTGAQEAQLIPAQVRSQGSEITRRAPLVGILLQVRKITVDMRVTLIAIRMYKVTPAPSSSANKARTHVPLHDAQVRLVLHRKGREWPLSVDAHD